MIDLPQSPEPLNPDTENSGPLMIVLTLKGDQLPAIYHFVQNLIDLGVGRSPSGDGLFYTYHKDMGVTQILFFGRGWLYAVAQFVRLMKDHTTVCGWSNWHLPFLGNNFLQFGDEDIARLRDTDFPAAGDLYTIASFVAQKMDVDDQGPEDVEGAPTIGISDLLDEEDEIEVPDLRGPIDLGVDVG